MRCLESVGFWNDEGYDPVIPFPISLWCDAAAVAVVDPDSFADSHGVVGANGVEATECRVPGVGSYEVGSQVFIGGNRNVLAVA